MEENKEIMEEKVVEGKKVEEKKKTVKEKIVAKDKAVANGYSLRISDKKAASICRVIRGKSPEAAVKRLEDVVQGKRAIPMAGREVPHQKGKGLAGARFPKNACVEIINLLKQVNANAIVNGIEKPVVTIAKANIASRPFKSHGRRAKRTHVSIEVMDKTKLVKKKK